MKNQKSRQNLFSGCVVMNSRNLITTLIAFFIFTNITLSQRIKLFQLEQKGVTKLGYVGITNSNGDQVYGKLDSFIRKNADTSNTNEAQSWTNSGSSSWTGTLSSFGGVGGGTTTFQSGSGISISHSSGTVTITASDISNINEAQSWSNSGTTSYTGTLSSVSGIGGGSFSIVGAGGTTISHSGGTVTITSSTGISGTGTTNYITKWTGTTSIGNSMLQDNGAELGVGTAPLTGYEVYVSSGSGTNTLTKIGNNSSLGSGLSNRISFGDNSFVYIAEEGADDQLTLYSTSLSIRIGAYGTGGSGQVLTSNGSVTTWQTPSDGSATNEAQTWSNAGSTSYTGTLSSISGVGGGSFSLLAGSNISISHSSGVVTISSSSLPSLSFSTSGTYVTTISNVSGSFKWVAGSGISISNAGTGADAIMTISATDNSATNEAQSWTNSGTSTYTGTLSNVSGVGGGSFSIAAGSGVTVSHSAGTVTISATGSAGSFSTSGSLVTTISGVTGSFQWVAGSGISVTNSGSSGTAVMNIANTGILGSGTSGTIPKFTASNTVGNSLLTDNGSTISIGSTIGAGWELGLKFPNITGYGTGAVLYMATTGDVRQTDPSQFKYQESDASMRGEFGGLGVTSTQVRPMYQDQYGLYNVPYSAYYTTISSGTANATDIVYLNASGNFTLPVGLIGKIYYIANTSGSAITITSPTSGSINGLSTYSLGANKGAVVFYFSTTAVGLSAN